MRPSVRIAAGAGSDQNNIIYYSTKTGSSAFIGCCLDILCLPYCRLSCQDRSLRTRPCNVLLFGHWYIGVLSPGNWTILFLLHALCFLLYRIGENNQIPNENSRRMPQRSPQRQRASLSASSP
jgi:hypothetical protein